jgi:hypothetical protein
MLLYIDLDSYNATFLFSNGIQQNPDRFERFLPAIINNELYTYDHMLIGKFGKAQVLRVDLFDERNYHVGSIYVLGKAGINELKETAEKIASQYGLHLDPYTFDEFNFLMAHPERSFFPEKMVQIVP